jgi:hypothetical protein
MRPSKSCRSLKTRQRRGLRVLLPRGSGSWYRRRRRRPSDVAWRRSAVLRQHGRRYLWLLSPGCFGQKLGFRWRRGMDLGADAIFTLLNRILKYNLFYAGRRQGHKRCRLRHRRPPARGRPSHRSWARLLWMMPGPLPRHRGWRRGRRHHRPWLAQGRVLPCTLLRVLRPQLGGSGRRPPQQS